MNSDQNCHISEDFHRATCSLGFRAMLSFSTIRTKSANDWTCIFCMIRARWTLMVFSTVPSSKAIILLGSPRATKGITSRSRAVKVSTRRCASSTSCRAARMRSSANHRLLDCAQENSVLDRLGQKIHGAGLHRFDAHRDVAVTGDEDNRQVAILGLQLPLQIDAGQPRHTHVEHQAAGLFRDTAGRCEKLLRRREGLHLMAGGLDQARQRASYRSIIID